MEGIDQDNPNGEDFTFASSSETLINRSVHSDDNTRTQSRKIRNNIGFWLLGLTNNYAYVVMLSAAFDILSKQLGDHKTKVPSHHGFHCNKVSTGAILLADILPALLIKTTAPFYMQRISYHIRVGFVVLTAFSSFILVALSPSPSASIIGVVCASLSSGLGEITFLSYSSYFNRDVITAWSSGTGAAGVFGAISYAVLTTAGLSPRDSILLMLVVPVILALSFWVILKRQPSVIMEWQSSQMSVSSTDVVAKLPFKNKLKLIKPLVKYMIPLFAVYVAEYTINQGLFEMIYFKTDWLDQAEQYRWFQVTYQIGVFISRSSATFVRFKTLEPIAAMQYVVFILLACQVVWRYIPSLWFVLIIILFEGFCGGAVYVNSFYNISEDVPESVVEYSLGVVSMADSAGIALAGLLSMPLHNYLCDYVTHMYASL